MVESSQTIINQKNIEGLRQNQTILNEKIKLVEAENGNLRTQLMQFQQQIQQIQQSNAIFQASIRGNGSTI